MTGIRSEGFAAARRNPQGVCAPASAPTVYCTGKTSSLGCVPFVTTGGVPSATHPDPFRIDGFSFGTYDLTQTTMGLSRDDYTHFQADYEKAKIFANDPFAVLDQEGVGKLVKFAVDAGRGSRRDLEVGICGEHGGEPASVEFCHRVGMTYVSCSPFMIPIARLAAAQARIREREAAGSVRRG